MMPLLFDLPDATKVGLSKLNSPHFLGYSALAEEVTQGRRDFREQFDFATELPVVFRERRDADGVCAGRDFSRPYWRLRGPNQWPREDEVPGFKKALLKYVISNFFFFFFFLGGASLYIPDLGKLPRCAIRTLIPVRASRGGSLWDPSWHI